MEIIENRGLLIGIVLLVVGLLDIFILRRLFSDKIRYDSTIQNRDLIEKGNNPSLDRVLQLVKITGIFCIVLGVYLIWRFR